MMSGVWRPDLFEIVMILFALVWMCTLYGTFVGASGDRLQLVIKFEDSCSDIDNQQHEALRASLVV